MPRAIRLAALTTALLALAAVAFGAESSTVTRINGIGLVDYRNKPDFKIGDWARYHVNGHSELGMHDDYVVTVLIAGEEDFWGDPCFWVETWTDMANAPPTATAALMSYGIFSDTLGLQRIQMYERKQIVSLNDDGSPREELNKVAASTFKMRREVQRPVHFDIDTLGVDTVLTPQGLFHVKKVKFDQGTGGTSTQGDSSQYTEVRESRTMWVTPQVPITHVAREDIVSSMARRTWMLGKSESSTALNTMDRGEGTSRLVAYGHGLTPRLVPPNKRRSLAEQRGTPAVARPARPAPRH